MRVITPAPPLWGCQRMAAYNPCMLHATHAPLAPLMSAGLHRLTLAANHLLGSEPQAVARLLPYVGRQVDGSAVLPALVSTWVSASAPEAAALVWRITPAGLLERLNEGELATPDATLALTSESMTHVMRSLATRDFSVVEIRGDAALAGDLRWVIENVRWDYAGDLERVLPAAVAAPTVRVARTLAAGLKHGIQTLESWRPKPPRAP